MKVCYVSKVRTTIEEIAAMIGLSADSDGAIYFFLAVEYWDWILQYWAMLSAHIRQIATITLIFLLEGCSRLDLCLITHNKSGKSVYQSQVEEKLPEGADLKTPLRIKCGVKSYI